MSFKIQSNNQGHDFSNRGLGFTEKEDSDEFNPTYFMSCFAEKV